MMPPRDVPMAPKIDILKPYFRGGDGFNSFVDDARELVSLFGVLPSVLGVVAPSLDNGCVSDELADSIVAAVRMQCGIYMQSNAERM